MPRSHWILLLPITLMLVLGPGCGQYSQMRVQQLRQESDALARQGQLDPAIDKLERAETLMQSVRQPDSTSLIMVHGTLGSLYRRTGRTSDAKRELELAAEAMRSSSTPPTATDGLYDAWILLYLVNIYSDECDLVNLVQTCDLAAARMAPLGLDETTAQYTVLLANGYERAGKVADAERQYTLALGYYAAPSSDRYGQVYTELAIARLDDKLGRADDGESHRQAAKTILDAHPAPVGEWAYFGLYGWADYLAEHDNYRGALDALDLASTASEQSAGINDEHRAYLRLFQAMLHLSLGETPEAKNLITEADRYVSQLPEPPPALTGYAQLVNARLAIAEGDVKSANQHRDSAVASMNQLPCGDDVDYGASLRLLADGYREAGALAEAEALESQADELAKRGLEAGGAEAAE
ncbi:MAG: hypothetical protein ABI743_05415 [bacterium]